MAITVLGFGASSMQGVGDSQGGFLKRLARPGITVVNHGVGGNTTRDMMARLDGARAVKRDWSVILLGCNDMPRRDDGEPGRRTKLEEYRRNLTTIFNALRSRDNLFITSFLVRDSVGIDPRLFADYMRVAIEEATAAGGYRIIDLYAASKDFGSRYWADDGIHFNDAGHQSICDLVLKQIGAAATSSDR